MTLAFKTQIDGQPTYFPEKIWSGLRDIPICIELNNYLHSPYAPKVDILDFKPKIHSIRDGHRWRAGMKIHMVINNRTRNRLQFAPVMEAVCVQDIIVRNLFNDRKGVYVAGRKLTKKKLEKLVINDGFESVDAFWNFFSGRDLIGQIIHWSDLKY